jgi:hypothetical protein
MEKSKKTSKPVSKDVVSLSLINTSKDVVSLSLINTSTLLVTREMRPYKVPVTDVRLH